MLNLRKSIVGIDIGTKTTKLVEIKEVKDGFALESFGSGPSVLPRGIDANKEEPIIALREAAANLKKLAKANKINGGDAYIAVSDQFVVTRLLTLPITGQEGLAEAIRSKLKPNLNLPLEKWRISWQSLGNMGGNQMVLVEMMTVVNQLEIEKLIRKAGFNPKLIDAACFNSFNAFYDYLADEEQRDRNIAIVSIGHQASTISIIKNARLRTVQTRSLGVFHLILALSKALDISEIQAQELLQKDTIFLPEFVGEQEEVENYKHIKPVFGELIRSIFSLFEYFVEKFKETRIDRMILTGGGANIKNIDIALSGHLNIEVVNAEALATLRGIAPLSRELLNVFSAAIGVGLRKSK